jgi:hypothetical protein
MAYYNYKVVRDMIPDDFSEKFIKDFEEENDMEYDHDANYDGHMWLLTAAYIDHLHSRIYELSATTTN